MPACGVPVQSIQSVIASSSTSQIFTNTRTTIAQCAEELLELVNRKHFTATHFKALMPPALIDGAACVRRSKRGAAVREVWKAWARCGICYVQIRTVKTVMRVCRQALY